INPVLRRAAHRNGLAMGVGSQRAGLKRADLTYTHTVVREQAPTTFLIANIGAPQLIHQSSTPALSDDEVSAAIDMIHADALAVHLNFLQESVQPEGERRARVCAAAIEWDVERVRVPVVDKATGDGLSRV